MNQTSIEQSALAKPSVGSATDELQQQPKLLLLNGDRTFHKLVAHWLMDENSKLYCQWVDTTRNS
jgi:hypothetical protein